MKCKLKANKDHVHPPEFPVFFGCHTTLPLFAANYKKRCLTHQNWLRRSRLGAKRLYIKYTFLSNVAAGSWICYTNQCLCIPRPYSMLSDNKSTHWLPFGHSLHRYHLTRAKASGEHCNSLRADTTIETSVYEKKVHIIC